MPFKKGDPNINREGRPIGAGISITTELKRELEKCPEGETKTYLQILVKRIMQKGIVDGDTQTLKQIWNYIDGMPNQTMNLNIDEYDKKQRNKIDELIKKSNIKSDSI